MRIEDYIKRWINNESVPSKCGNINSTDDMLFSYSTIIAQKLNPEDIVVNLTSYSRTTRKHQNYVCRYYVEYKYVLNIPKGTKDLMDYYRKDYWIRDINNNVSHITNLNYD